MSKKALLVGINYIGTKNQLNGCIDDINDIKDYLIGNKSFDPQSIVCLSDDQTDPTRIPNQDNIIRHLTIGVSQMKAGDVLYFHYSGHGSIVRNFNGQEPSGFDETIVPLDFETTGMIQDQTLRNIVNNVPEGAKFVAVMDSCHSNGTFDLRYLYDPVSKKIAEKKELPYVVRGKRQIHVNKNIDTVEEFPETKGQVIALSGCREDQTSADAYINNRYNGAMTRALLDTLNKTKGDVVLRDLPGYTRLYIANNHLGDQIPRLSFGRNDFSLDTPLL